MPDNKLEELNESDLKLIDQIEQLVGDVVDVPLELPKLPTMAEALRRHQRFIGDAASEKRVLPSYRFKNIRTGETHDLNGNVSDRNKFLEDNPEWEQMIIGTPIISHNGLPKKPSDHFREKLRAIKKGYKGSNINTF